mmetsp:Transcript_90928/g.293572  ORF Transcript_90928/g.293572 Transcript_90928/m.293572 type:complete len:120 (-) Transcript_90928:73-432(-)
MLAKCSGPNVEKLQESIIAVYEHGANAKISVLENENASLTGACSDSGDAWRLFCHGGYDQQGRPAVGKDTEHLQADVKLRGELAEQQAQIAVLLSQSVAPPCSRGARVVRVQPSRRHEA